MAAPKVLTLAEYLQADEASEVPVEFVDGRVYAMSGGTIRHALIVGNVIHSAKVSLRGGPCNAYPSDLRVEVGPNYVHPDVTVICGEPKVSEALANTVSNPVLIFEVLSPTTESYDRGRKLRIYTGLPSLQSYVLVSQDSPVVETFHRQGDSWIWENCEGLDGVLKIGALDLTINLADVYEGVDFSKPE